jgi:diaminohydroxyphosphoribosylaminopyrimidine deaminase/5-amino-6-(5-phosphoribosylamino)uracil reductase
MSDIDWMRRALELARRGEGAVEPNPMVGAVLVRDGVIVGEGWHERFGEAHAEVNAIAAAGDRARGATMYVTLEPCCHHGKTPPCTDAVIRAGIVRVVAAMADPFPHVAGGGLKQLRDAGMARDVGVLEAESRRLNAPYLTLVEKGRPFVHAKWAMTLDGKIATRTGHSKWISGEEARARAHALRGRMDAIIVGAGTVRLDDPLLTARRDGPRKPTRIVMSRDGRLPDTCQLLQTAKQTPVLIAGGQITSARQAHLRDAGCEVLTIATIAELLAELGKRRFTNVLVEGGAAVLGSFRDAGLIDMVHVFVAPKLVGGLAALTPIAGVGATTIDAGLRVADWECEKIGKDFYLRGWVDTSHTPT